MGKILVNLSLSLDGVIQAPGRLDEDTRNGFTAGGWAGPYFHPMMAEGVGAPVANPPSFLFGRRTYEDFFSVWPNRGDNPFTNVLNAREKVVASTTLKEPLPWQNSTLLKGDAIAAIKTMKASRDFVVLGSVGLLQSLMRANLVDEWRLLIHPLVLGQGAKLFRDGYAQKLKLVDSKATPTGVIIATYILA